MTAAGRVVAVFAGLALILLAAVDLVREAVLAAHEDVSWPFADWWAQLSAEPTWVTAVVAAAVLAAAAALIALAASQLGASRNGPVRVQFGDQANRAQLDVPAVERALRSRLEKDLPGVKTRALELNKRGDGWWVRLEADLPARDVRGLQARAGGLLTADLARMGGLRLDGLDVVVTRLT